MEKKEEEEEELISYKNIINEKQMIKKHTCQQKKISASASAGKPLANRWQTAGNTAGKGAKMGKNAKLTKFVPWVQPTTLKAIQEVSKEKNISYGKVVDLLVKTHLCNPRKYLEDQKLALASELEAVNVKLRQLEDFEEEVEYGIRNGTGRLK